MGEEDTVKALQQIKKELKASDILLVGELFGDSGCISLTYSPLTDSLVYYDPYNAYSRKEVALGKLPDLCRALHIITPFKF